MTDKTSANETKYLPSHFISTLILSVLLIFLTMVFIPPALASDTAITPEIEALARSLMHDPDRIYQYVLNNIDFEPTFGSKKGAAGALLDKSGNAFDQCSLMIALLRASGFEANYVIGRVSLPFEKAADWLGIPSSVNQDINGEIVSIVNSEAVNNVLVYGGIPRYTGFDFAYFDHVWVSATIDGSKYVFDPSMKRHIIKKSATFSVLNSFDYDDFVSTSTVGATVTNTFIQQLDRESIRNKLSEDANNLAQIIKTENIGLSLYDVLGVPRLDSNRVLIDDRWVVLETDKHFRHGSLSYQVAVIKECFEIPNEYRTAINFDLLDIDYTTFSSEIYGDLLSISFDSDGRAIIKHNNELVAKSSISSENSKIDLNISIDQPYPYNEGTLFDENFTVSLDNGVSTTIITAWGVLKSNDVVKKFENISAAVSISADDHNKDIIFSNAMTAIGKKYDTQFINSACLMAHSLNAVPILHSSVALIRNNNNYAALNHPIFTFVNALSLSSSSSDGSDFKKVWDTLRYAGASIGSIFEAEVYRQTLGGQGFSAAYSIDTAIKEGKKVFKLNNATLSLNQSELHYSDYLINSLGNWLSNNNYAVIPEEVLFMNDQYDLIGYIVSGDKYVVSYTDFGGLWGWFSDLFDSVVNWTKETINELFGSNEDVPAEAPGLDPVDMRTGNFFGRKTDLAIGTDGPASLKLTRYYNSGVRLLDSPLGLGWRHNYQVRAIPISTGDVGIMDSQALPSASSVIGLYATVSLFYNNIDKFVDSNHGTRQADGDLLTLVLAAMTNSWVVDNLTNDAVVVSAPGNSKIYRKLPDGSYASPPGDSSQLSSEGGVFIVRDKHGNSQEFDSEGMLSILRDFNDNDIRIHYSDDKVSRVENDFGHFFNLLYDENRLVSVIDSAGRQVHYDHDEIGNLITITDPIGNMYRYEYDQPGRIQKVFKPTCYSAPYLTNNYDSIGKIANQTDALGHVSLCYVLGDRTELKTPDGMNTTYYFNRYGKILREDKPDGSFVVSIYNDGNLLIARNQSDGFSQSFDYDDNLNIVKITTHPKTIVGQNSSLNNLIQSYVYDQTFNRPLTYTDRMGRVTDFVYDDNGNLLQIDLPSVNEQAVQTTFAYNSRGQVLTATNAEGMVTQNVYDPTTGYLLRSIVDAARLNLTTTMEYDDVGNMLKVYNPRGKETLIDYNVLRNPTSITYADSTVVAYEYNADGKVITTELRSRIPELPYQTITTTYTPMGDKETITDTLGGTTRFEYDVMYNLISVTDPEGRMRRYTYDSMGRKIGEYDGLGNTVREWTYNPAGKIATQADGNGQTTTYGYDAYNRVISIIYPDGKSDKITQYDNAGNVLELENRDHYKESFEYDDLNRLISKYPLADSITERVNYTYDRVGRKTTVVGPEGETIFDYDTAGRLIMVMDPNNRAIAYQYDNAGNRIQVDYPDGSHYNYEYDDLNRVKRVLENSAVQLAAYDYDGFGRRAMVTYANGATQSFDYDEVNRLSTLVHSFGTHNATFEYGYDRSGMRIGVNPPERFAPVLSDMNGVLDFEHNIMNQYTSVGINPLTWNANGNLESDGTFSFSHDYLNRLRTVSGLDVSANYEYDSFNRRVSKVVNSVMTGYFYDQDRCVIEYDGVGAVERKFVYGPGIDEPILMETGGQKYYYHSNALGSVVALSDQSGEIAESYRYTPFGQVQDAGSLGNPYLFTGRRYDAETGLYYYRARFYHPELRRFMEPDPIGYGDGMNLYAYVLNNPVMRVDPSGEYVQEIIVGGVVVYSLYLAYKSIVKLMEGADNGYIINNELWDSTVKFNETHGDVYRDIYKHVNDAQNSRVEALKQGVKTKDAIEDTIDVMETARKACQNW